MVVATYEFDSDDGEHLRGYGMELRDAAFGTTLRDDDCRLRDAGIYVTKVAGVRRRMRELQRDAFRPMEVLTLRRERDNPHDPNAVAVFDRKGRTMIGYVPRDEAPAIAALLDEGAELDCRCLWEWRDEEGRRCAVKILVVPKGMIDLR